MIGELCALTERALVASLHDLNAATRFATHALLLWGDGRTLAGAADDVLTAAALSDLSRRRSVECKQETKRSSMSTAADSVAATRPASGVTPPSSEQALDWRDARSC